MTLASLVKMDNQLLYTDTEEKLGNYFGEDGIKEVKQASLSEL